MTGWVSPPPAFAQAKSWRIERMDTTLDVQKNSDVVVDETVTFVFQGTYHYVTRSIPTGNLESLDQLDVRQDGRSLPQGDGPGTWAVSRSGDRRIIRVNFDLTDTAATYTFHYVARGAIQFFDQGDELRWYVFDAETPVEIGEVTTIVRLPGNVPRNQLTAAISTGPQVANQVTSPGASTLTYTAHAVPPYTQFWIVAGFPKGVVEFHWTARRIAAFAVPKVGFLLPILTLLGMLLMWRRRGRDDPQAVFASFVTEPPSDLPPAIAGALIDERVDVKEVVATIVDLASRGYLEISESKEGWPSFLAKTVTTFKRLKPSNDLTGVDHQVMEGLFDQHPDEVTSEDLKNHFYKHVDRIVRSVYDEVTGRQLFVHNPKSTRAAWVGIGIGVGVVLGGISFLMAYGGIPGWGFFLAGSIVSALIVIAFSRAMPARTRKGAQEYRKWEAFRTYLKDLTRFQDMQNARDVFERYLPYAVALGVEREWTRRFSDLAVPAPVWYRPVYLPVGPWAQGGGLPGTQTTGLPTGMPGAGGGIGSLPSFSLDSISDSLFSSLNSVSTVLTSRPSSSGSGRGAWGGGGGGFGGGFSGGGGGGGFGAG